MPDYTGLTEAEYIVLLDARDATIVTKDGEIATLTQTVTDKDAEIATLEQDITDKDTTIATLTQSTIDKQNSIDQLTTENEALQTVEGSLGILSDMDAVDKQSLAHKARTTQEGLSAFMAINYGATLAD